MSEKQYSNLAEGKYGSKQHPGLYIHRYLGSSETKTPGLFRHSFAVKALSNGSGETPPGGAFLSFNLDPEWTEPEWLNACGFEVEAPVEAVAAVEAQINEQAAQQVVADAEASKIRKGEENFNDEQKMAARVNGIKAQVRISIGTIYRLCDWDDRERDAQADLADFEATDFSGIVTHKEQSFGVHKGRINAEVAVLPRAEAKAK